MKNMQHSAFYAISGQQMYRPVKCFHCM